MDPRKEKKTILPIIPRSSILYNQDSTSLLREVFHDVLQKPELPENVVENWAAFKCDSEYDKTTASKLQSIAKESCLKKDTISIVEKKLSLVINTNLQKESNLDDRERELKRLKRDVIFPNIDQKDVQEYNLLTGNDLRPIKIYETIDFRFERKSKITMLKRPNDLDMPPTKLPNICRVPSVAKTSTTINSRDRHAKKAPHTKVLNKGSDVTAWNDLCTREPKTKRKSISRFNAEPENFRLNKTAIVFNNYKLNVTYRKKFSIQNISTCLQPILLPSRTEKNETCFMVKPLFNPEKIRLSAGMSATFLVIFKAQIFMDVIDTYEVNGHKIKFISCRESPNITVYLLQNIWPAHPRIHSNFNIERCQALNYCIEAGSCFLGERMTTYLIFKNSGGYAKFFIMTDDQWISQNINTLHPDLQLDFGDFAISPNYFELDKEEFLIIQLDFYGSTSGMSIENLYLVCNNITWESIDIIADALIFDKYSVTVNSPDAITKARFIIAQKTHPCVDNFLIIERSSVSTLPEPTVVSNEYPSTSNIQIGAKLTSTLSNDTIDEIIFDYLLKLENRRDQDNSPSEEEFFTLPENVLFMGNCLGGKKLRKTINIKNNTMLNLKCRWSIEKTNLKIYKLADLKHINSNCVEIDNCAPYLPAYGEVKAEVIMGNPHSEEGYFAASIGLIIEDIPLCAVTLDYDNPCFKIIESTTDVTDENDGQQIVDIQVFQIDAFILVKSLRILIIPRNIFGSCIYEPNTTINREFRLIVDSEIIEELKGFWIGNADGTLTIKPENFTILPRVPMVFNLQYKVTSRESNVVEQITVVIENIFTRTINLHVHIAAPHIKFSRNKLNLGLLTIGNKYVCKFYIINNNDINIDWEIREQYKREIEGAGGNVVEVTAKNLECGDVEISYKVVAKAPIKWFSYLMLYIIDAYKKTEQSRITIHYEIANTVAYVHSDMSECSILSPLDVLYVGNTSTYQICFHNLTTQNALFQFEKVYGSDSANFEVNTYPKAFKVRDNISTRVNVQITPSAAGIFEQIYLSFQQVCDNPYVIGPIIPALPLVLTVLVVVDDIYVKITLPPSPLTNAGASGERFIFWPEKGTNIAQQLQDRESQSDSYNLSNDRDIDNTTEHDYWVGQYATCSTTSLYSQLLTATDPIDLTFQRFSDDTDMDSLPSDLVNYLRTLEPPLIEKPTMASESSSNFTSDTTITEAACSNFKERSCKLINASPYLIEMCGLELRKIHRVTIQLENLTPVQGNIEVKLENFFAKEYEKSKMDAIYQKLKYLPVEAEWEKKIGPHGIVIDCNTLDGTHSLQPFKTNELVLSIYANTWGTYKEELSINFNQILPIKITVIMEIVGVPLEFPIGINNVHNCAILRFGELAYKSDFVLRPLLVKNIAEIPVTVTWHIFMRHTNEELGKEPISVLFDIYNPYSNQSEDISSRGNLLIGHGKCVGQSDHRIFKMYPHECHIAPKETITLKLGINTYAYAASFNPTEICAYLIGYTYLPSSLNYNPNIFYRPIAHNNYPVKAKLTATLVLPMLKLQMSSEDLHMTIYADNLLDVGYIKQVRHFTMKNVHEIEANVDFTMEEPFVLESCTTGSVFSAIPADDICARQKFSAVVLSKEICKLSVSYEIDTNKLMEIAASLFKKSGDFEYCNDVSKTQYSYDITKYLEIGQKGFRSQFIPVTLSIYFPILEVTEKLDFGDVYISNVGHQVCTIKNFSSCKVDFSVEESKTFRVLKNTGSVNPGRYQQPQIYDLMVAFIPQLKVKFEETIVIRTRIPSLFFTIKVTGVGRLNEHFYKPDVC